MNNKKLLTTKEVAAYLKINEKKVYKLIREKSIPCTRIVGKWLFPLDQINRWLEEQIEISNNILIAGSDDPLLIYIIGVFNKKFFPDFMVFHASIGSQNGLVSLAEGKSQVAGVHLFHPSTEEYNIPYIRKHLGHKKYIVVTLAHRKQGLIVPKGNPLNICGFPDVVRPDVYFVNRNRGSGTRYLIDYYFEKYGIIPSQVKGYVDSELNTHMEVGLAILRGKYNVGMGIEYVANLLGLDFIPITEERFDLVTMKENFFAHPMKNFFELIQPEELTLKASFFEGYNFRDTGNIVFP